MAEFNFSGYHTTTNDEGIIWRDVDVNYSINKGGVKTDYVVHGKEGSMTMGEETRKYLHINTATTIRQNVFTFAARDKNIGISQSLRTFLYGTTGSICINLDDLPELLVIDTDFRMPVLGLTKKTALIYAANHQDYFPRFSNSNVSHEYPDLVRLATKRKIKVYDPTQAEIDNAVANPIPKSDLFIYGFFAICSLAKKSYTSPNISEEKKNVSYMKKWVDQRLKALSIKCCFQLRREIEENNYSWDLLLVSRYLEYKPDIRPVLYTPLLTLEKTEKKMDASWSAFRSYARLILADTGMKSFLIAKTFAEDCETQAHIIRVVVEESIYIEKVWDQVREESTLGKYSPGFYYIFNGLLPEMERRHFPNLLYCAMYKLNGNGSWDHYAGNVRPTHNLGELRRNTDILLLSVDEKKPVMRAPPPAPTNLFD